MLRLAMATSATFAAKLSARMSLRIILSTGISIKEPRPGV